MSLIIFDVEATCWKPTDPQGEQEIIELGAVKLDENLENSAEFDRFVRPINNPVLSEFCSNLTHIVQKDLDNAALFNQVFETFLEWIGHDYYRIGSWGNYDIGQLKSDCRRHDLKFPKRWEKRHLNLKQLFAEKKRIRPCGMDQALAMMHIPLQGIHHRAIDDARNIARIAKTLLL